LISWTGGFDCFDERLNGASRWRPAPRLELLDGADAVAGGGGRLRLGQACRVSGGSDLLGWFGHGETHSGKIEGEKENLRIGQNSFDKRKLEFC
jgi:hypothetical protein